MAQNEREREAFWRLRESIPEAQRKDGASLKHDISVPVSQVPRFIEVAGAWVAQHIPQGVLVSYGHLGDGNLHFNINQRAGTQVFQLQAVEQKVKRAIHDFVKEFGGSFSAEHGIGQLKVFELERYANPVELDLMRRVKQAFDPNGIMNPGKVLRPLGSATLLRRRLHQLDDRAVRRADGHGLVIAEIGGGDGHRVEHHGNAVVAQALVGLEHVRDQVGPDLDADACSSVSTAGRPVRHVGA